LGTPGRMETNSLPGSRDRRLQISQRLLRFRRDKPSGSLTVHCTRFAVGGYGLGGEVRCIALLPLTALESCLSQEGISQTSGIPDLFKELVRASVRLKSLLVVAQPNQDIRLTTEREPLNKSVTDLLVELASISVGVESLLILAQPKQDFRFAIERVSLSPSIPDLLEESAGVPVGVESLFIFAQPSQDVSLTKQRVCLSRSHADLLVELASISVGVESLFVLAQTN